MPKTSAALFLAFCLSMPVAALCAESAPSFNLVGKALPKTKLRYQNAPTELAGKPAIVEFWSTWCGPCRAVVPHLNDLYAKYKDRGLVILGVSIDEEFADLEKYGPKFGIKYPVAFDEAKKLSSELKIDAIPYALAVDKSGKIVWEGVSSTLNEDVIEQILK